MENKKINHRPLECWRTIARKFIGFNLAQSVIIGPEHRQWLRIVMNQETHKLVSQMDYKSLSVLEISGDFWKDRFPFFKYKSVNYPEYDITKSPLNEKFDLIIAEQVWEHLKWPIRATKNVKEMLSSDGYFLVTTPFLVRFHPQPDDCSRWTETGLKYFLNEAAGFEIDKIQSGSWGNQRCVKSNLFLWRRYLPFFHSLKNDPFFPISVWALAKNQ
jgi:SAM-dependent methyltransferase